MEVITEHNEANRDSSKFGERGAIDPTTLLFQLHMEALCRLVGQGDLGNAFSICQI